MATGVSNSPQKPFNLFEPSQLQRLHLQLPYLSYICDKGLTNTRKEVHS